MKWTLVQRIGGDASSALVLIILARLLPPSEFGVVAIAATWIAFLALFGELGFGAALVQSVEAGPDEFTSVFALNVVLGAILTSVGVALSWPVAALMHTPQVQPVMATISASFIIRAISLTHNAVAQKHLEFRRLAIRDTLASVLSGLVGIGLALSGAGVWSLVTQSVMASTLSTLWMWTSADWQPKFRRVQWGRLRTLVPYSSRMFCYTFVKYFAMQGDRLVIGHLLGAAALGLYTTSTTLILYPFRSIMSAVGTYLFPKLAAVQCDSSLTTEYMIRTYRFASVLGFPLAGILFFLGPHLLPPLLGPRWLAMAPLIPGIAIMAGCYAFISPIGEFMKALNRPQWLLNWSLGFAGLTLASMLIGVRYGVVGVINRLAIAYLIGAVVSFCIALRLLGLNSVYLARQFGRALLLCTLTVLPACWLSVCLIATNKVLSVLIVPISLTAFIVSLRAWDGTTYETIRTFGAMVVRGCRVTCR